MRSTPQITVCLAVLVVLGASGELVIADDAKQFSTGIGAILTTHCLRCHNSSESAGGLVLETHEALMAGGDSGPAVVGGNLEASSLWEQVRGEEPAMPQGGDPLTAPELEMIEAWIRDGAVWPEGLVLQPPEPDEWWSLQPLSDPVPPQTDEHRTESDHRVGNWARTPIDKFILRTLHQHNLEPAPPADKRTLARRLYFDLTGLPPTSSQLNAFLTDTSIDAYERLVDQLLASPRYGERWARHWLDVVHYGDTHGYDKDKPRPNAWPYRDYVVQSFNSDTTYEQFVREQLAADVIWPDRQDAIRALGFIAAGPWDFIGHAEVPETKIDGKVARNLDRDDMVSSAMNTFLSTTVQCARCHDHKFDPITQEQYYGLQAVFAALDRADRRYDTSPETARRRAALERRRDKLVAQQAQVQTELESVNPAFHQRLTELSNRVAQRQAEEFGYHSSIAETSDEVKWVQFDLRSPTELRNVTLVGCFDDFNQIGAGFGFPVRFRIEACNDPDFRQHVHTIVDHTQEDVPNPGIAPFVFDAPRDLPPTRYVRVTATKLAVRKNDYIFALAECIVLDEAQTNAAANSEVQSRDSIEQGPRWARANLIDGKYPGHDADAALITELQKLIRQQQQWQTQPDVVAAMLRKTELDQQIDEVKTALDLLPAPHLVYAGTIHHGSGAFRGTGADGGRPRTIHVLHRGEVMQPLAEAHPGVLPFFRGEDWRFDLPPDHHETARRKALAEWIVRDDHPLTWRSLVNRIWLHHFGRGLVDSPNDFGRMGELPTHPELLDWLARWFRDQGQSIKSLHRLIVASSVYRQRAQHNDAFAKIDSDNRFYWRANRRALDAEGLRDTILVLSGQMNFEMYGPGFKDFVVVRPEHSPHYEYHLHDPADRSIHRRSIYRFLVRSQQQPLMQTLDCADPSQSVAKRGTTLTAIQALMLQNDRFVTYMAERFAASMAERATTVEAQVELGVRDALGRAPTTTERDALRDFVAEHGLENFARLLFNLNEFAFVD